MASCFFQFPFLQIFYQSQVVKIQSSGFVENDHRSNDMVKMWLGLYQYVPFLIALYEVMVQRLWTLYETYDDILVVLNLGKALSMSSDSTI